MNLWPDAKVGCGVTATRLRPAKGAKLTAVPEAKAPEASRIADLRLGHQP